MIQAHVSRLGLIAIAMLSGCLFPIGKAKAKKPAYIDPGPWAGPLHEKHAGKVVFSSAPIPMDGSDDSAAYATYTLGEPLFMRYWGKESPHNLQPCEGRSVTRNVSQTVGLYADVNGAGASLPIDKLPSFGMYEVSNPNTRGMASLSNELERAFTSPIELVGGAEIAGEAAVRRFNMQIIPMLKEGKNTLRIVIALSCPDHRERAVVAEGTIAVEVPPGSMAAYMAKYGPRVQQSPHPENEQLAREIVAAMKKKADWDNEVFVGALVTSEAWQPVRNRNTGVLVAYEIGALLFVRLKTEKDPERCRAFNMAYRRDPAGGTLYFAGTGNSKPFPCSAAPR